ncbi:MAG: hypothetical protein GX605_02175, partial [Chloroflexi bacterium]|nr:hypothetical protein [Chloroflexota bacterium]
MARVRRWLLQGAVAAALLFVLAGCSAVPDKSDKVLDEWSKGLRLGAASLNQPLAMQVDPTGSPVHLAWSQAGAQGMEMRYLRLENGTERGVEQPLAPPQFFPRQPHLVLGSQGLLHIFFLASEGRGQPDGVYQALVGSDGRFAGPVVRRTPLDRAASGYRALAGPQGGIHLLWCDEAVSGGGIYHSVVPEADGEAGPARLVIPGGREVDAVVDRQGVLHLAWVEQPAERERNIRYGRLEAESDALLGAQTVGSAPDEIGLITYPPRLGLDS